MSKRKGPDTGSCNKRPRLDLSDQELLHAVEDIEDLNNSQANLDLVELCNLQSKLNNTVETFEDCQQNDCFNSQFDRVLVEASNLQSQLNFDEQIGGGVKQASDRTQKILPGHASTELSPKPSTSTATSKEPIPEKR